ncbi:hydroxyectoine utilization dehydratase EutB [Tropicimonas sp. IMCC34043]|uniref:hydroxyectoine utilization dehydratase EutB n=1 Tax=Tropicimonas sp. IMCC34043 TaxID=2248760 RepID=UPI000E252195|nr:hydroxyectoine utilization dehydratase EutB [Tropicimonas sp. IMCC34043]
MSVDVTEIEAARARIRDVIRRTECDLSDALTDIAGAPVWLKLEHRQHTGAFKLRGASNAVAQLGAQGRKAGVTAASTGNHGRALAYAARRAGVPCVICMSRLVPGNKIAAIEALGAEARIIGNSQDDAEIEALRLVEERGMEMVPPFDDPRIIAGQGTLGLEMAEDVPDAACVAVPLSGGGLIAGVAAAMKARCPGLRVIGISMARGAAMQASLQAGRPVQVTELPSLADSLGGGIGLQNRHSFAMVRDLVDEVIVLSEPEIAAGIRHCYHAEREIVEGAAAVGVAALLAGKLRVTGPLVLPLTGRNIDMDLHRRIVNGEDVDLMAEEAA